MKVINFFVKGVAKTTISATKDGANPSEFDGVRWFAAQYNIATKEAYFLREGGTVVGASITLSEPMLAGVLKMKQG